MLAPDYIKGLTLLGGDPFEPKNQQALLPFIKRVKEKYPNKNIWAYSGFLYEDMITEGTYSNCPETKEILSLIDVLVDGKYVDELKNLSLRFRGSSNQRLIDMKETLKTGSVVTFE